MDIRFKALPNNMLVCFNELNDFDIKHECIIMVVNRKNLKLDHIDDHINDFRINYVRLLGRQLNLQK